MGAMKGAKQLLLGGVLGVAVVAAVMKPSQSSFQDYLDKWIAKEVVAKFSEAKKENQSLVDRLWNSVDQSVSVLQNKFTTPVFYNLLILQIAKTMSRGNEMYFVGMFGRWFSLNSLDRDLVKATMEKVGK